MTHSNVDPKDKIRLGIGDGLIRLSIGIENVQDLVVDLTQALEAI
jgi:cystathionine beta-lyase/cystathionine gamma-synthase